MTPLHAYINKVLDNLPKNQCSVNILLENGHAAYGALRRTEAEGIFEILTAVQHGKGSPVTLSGYIHGDSVQMIFFLQEEEAKSNIVGPSGGGLNLNS